MVRNPFKTSENSPKTPLKPKKTSGLLLRTSRRVLIWFGLIDESTYVRPFFRDRFVAFLLWFIDLVINGLIYTGIVIFGYLAFKHHKAWAVAAFGLLHFAVGEAYIAYRKYEQSDGVKKR